MRCVSLRSPRPVNARIRPRRRERCKYFISRIPALKHELGERWSQGGGEHCGVWKERMNVSSKDRRGNRRGEEEKEEAS